MNWAISISAYSHLWTFKRRIRPASYQFHLQNTNNSIARFEIVCALTDMYDIYKRVCGKWYESKKENKNNITFTSAISAILWRMVAVRTGRQKYCYFLCCHSFVFHLLYLSFSLQVFFLLSLILFLFILKHKCKFKSAIVVTTTFVVVVLFSISIWRL